MGLNTLGGVKISRSAPKIQVRIVNNREDISTASLFMARVGEDFEYAEYPPTRIGADYLEFTFDDLTFDKKFGRFKARLVVESETRSVFYLVYQDDTNVCVNNA